MHLRRVSLPLAALFLFLLAGSGFAQTLSRNAGPPGTPAFQADSAEGDTCPEDAVLLTQNSSQTVVTPNGVACTQQPPAPQYHLDNYWYRSYDLENHGVFGAFHVCAVEFGVELSQSPGGAGQPITVRIGVTLDSDDDPFPSGFRHTLASVDTTLPDLANQIFVVPFDVVVPSGAQVYVEVLVPDGVADQHILFPGGNPQPETAPAYIRSIGCSISDPMTMADINYPDSHPVMNLLGEEVDLVATGLEVDQDPNLSQDPNSVIGVGDTKTVGTEWRNDFAAPTLVNSLVSSLLPQGALTMVLPDTTANYGSMAPGVPTSCVSTGDCSVLTIGGAKALGVDEDVFLYETGLLTYKIWNVHVGGSFADVPSSSNFYRFIETILHHGVTAGCGAGNYCPGNSTTREQMAVFVLRAKEGQNYLPPACSPPNIFNDVPASSPFCRWIEELSNRGVVAGCGAGNYCPGNPVTREQMAVFVLRTLDPALDPPLCMMPTVFSDVPASSPFCRWVEELYNRGVVAGCGGGNYCPTNPVTREQMGVFLTLTFNLVLYGP